MRKVVGAFFGWVVAVAILGLIWWPLARHLDPVIHAFVGFILGGAMSLVGMVIADWTEPDWR